MAFKRQQTMLPEEKGAKGEGTSETIPQKKQSNRKLAQPSLDDKF
jgi:hypothetical protein